MRDELYINGIKADMSSSAISLKYNSNLLTDIGKIVSNNSHTIRLPKTSNNLQLIECAHIPSSESRFPYIRHAGMLIRDGVLIISDANVILLSIDDYIDVALSWGNVNNLAPITEGSLKDLRYTLDDYVVWEKGDNSRIFPLVNYGFQSEDTDVWYHPAVSVRWIMDKISASAGVTFNLPSDRTSELEELFIPVLETNDSELQSQANSNTLVPYKIVQNDFFRILCFTVRKSGDYYFSMTDDKTLRSKGHKVKITVSGYITFEVDVNGNNGAPNTASIPVKLEIRNKKSNGTPVLATILADVDHIAGQRYRYTFAFRDCAFEMDPDYEVSFTMIDIYTIGVDVYTVSVVSGQAGSLFIKGMFDEIKLGDKYYIVPNLPDIKQIDFLKAISSMLGLFAVPTDDGKITFVSFDMLERNKTKAIDWTKLIMYKNNVQLPSDMEFTLDDMARINRFKYKDDDGVNDEAYIAVDNLTLEPERVAVELPFAASQMLNLVAQIPMYSYEDGKLKKESVSPRILRYQDNSGVFTDMSWNTLLEKYYGSYKALVTNAKVITEMVKLNAVQLKNVDLTTPIYLRQYGSYFAIVSIKTKNDNICEVKLIKM